MLTDEQVATLVGALYEYRAFPVAAADMQLASIMEHVESLIAAAEAAAVEKCAVAVEGEGMPRDKFWDVATMRACAATIRALTKAKP